MRRNPAVEFYRVVAMFGIVMLHAIVQGGYLRGRGLDNVLMSCVTAFVFISGYFGIRFSAQKVVRLVALGCYCACVATLIGGVPMMLVDIIKYHWFLWAYLVLMCFSPILNCAFEGGLKEVAARVAPVLLVVFGWSYLAMIPGLREYCPTVQGFGALSPLTLIGIYLAARFCRRVLTSFCVRTWMLVATVIVSLPLTWIGFGHYNSIASLALAGSVFCLVERISIPARIGQILDFIVPSLFPVYLLHCNAVGYEYLKILNRFFIEDCHFWLYVSYLLTASVFFVACLLLDLPRRLVVAMVERRRK